MAWFNNSEKNTTLPNLTLERIKNTLDRLDLTYEASSENPIIKNIINDRAVIFSAEYAESFYYIAVFSSGSVLPKERYDEVVNWANKWNENTLFGTAQAILDEDETVFLKVDCVFPVAGGINDQQLELYTNVALSCALDAVENYVKDLNVPNIAKPDSQPTPDNI